MCGVFQKVENIAICNFCCGDRLGSGSDARQASAWPMAGELQGDWRAKHRAEFRSAAGVVGEAGEARAQNVMVVPMHRTAQQTALAGTRP